MASTQGSRDAEVALRSDPRAACAWSVVPSRQQRLRVLVSTRDGHTFRRQLDLESLAVRDLAASPDGRVTWTITITPSTTPEPRAARSTNNGLTFDFVGDRFANSVMEIIEVAPPIRGGSTRAAPSATPPSYFAVTMADSTGSEPPRFGGPGAYVSGVDPRDPDVLYLLATTASTATDASAVDSAGVLYRSVMLAARA